MILLPCCLAWAQAQKGTIINEDVLVYSQPDFDAPVVGSLKFGGVYDISTGKKGAFYKIRLKPGTTAWIADNDIKPGVVQEAVQAARDMEKANQAKKKSRPEAAAEKRRKQRPFDMQRFRGPSLDMLQFKESTLGKKPSENLLFYGLKFAGANTLFDGDIQTEANLIVHLGAPSYYEKATAQKAQGWIFITNFLFLNTTPISPRAHSYFGFGPMFKFSHFDLALSNGTRTTSYAADDMSLGAVFNFGLAFKLSDYALRLDAKYYWEKQSYLGAGLSFLWSF